METNKHSIKSEKIIEIAGWIFSLIGLVSISLTSRFQLFEKTELAFSGLILTVGLLYYYIVQTLLHKSRTTKTIADIVFTVLLMYLAIQTNAYFSLLLILPITSAFLMSESINSLLVASITILFVGIEIVISNFTGFRLILDPPYLFITISVLLTFFIRYFAQLAFYEKNIKESEEFKLSELGRKMTLLEHQSREFTSLAAQQIFTPLATIQSFIQTLKSGKTGPLTAKQKEFINETASYIEKMHKLIKELLYITKIELNEKSLNFKLVNLVDIIKTTIHKYGDVITDKEMQVNFHYPNEEMPDIRADENYLKEVFDRLIDNTIRYSPKKSQAHITLQIIHRQEQPYLSVEIKDQGFGIPTEEQKYLFKKFFRGTNVIEKENFGNGLSLFITKLIADRHNAILKFQSQLDQGTTFTLDFPLNKQINKQKIGK